MDYFKNAGRAALLALSLFVATLLPEGALAQTVSQLPTAVSGGLTVTDMGNGPLEIRVVQGNLLLATSQGNNGSLNSSSSASTTLTLTNTPTTPPCIGCQISGSGITSGTTVAAYNGTTGITLSAAMTIPANTLIQWGAACPSTPNGLPVLPFQANVGADLPLYTQARICGWSQNAAGAQVLPFPIGAH